MDNNQVKTALWMLLRLGAPRDQSPEFQRAWFEGFLATTRALGYDFGPEDFSKLDHINDFFERGGPESFEEWAAHLAEDAEEDEAARLAKETDEEWAARLEEEAEEDEANSLA